MSAVLIFANARNRLIYLIFQQKKKIENKKYICLFIWRMGKKAPHFFVNQKVIYLFFYIGQRFIINTNVNEFGASVLEMVQFFILFNESIQPV